MYIALADILLFLAIGSILIVAGCTLIAMVVIQTEWWRDRSYRKLQAKRIQKKNEILYLIGLNPDDEVGTRRNIIWLQDQIDGLNKIVMELERHPAAAKDNGSP